MKLGERDVEVDVGTGESKQGLTLCTHWKFSRIKKNVKHFTKNFKAIPKVTWQKYL